MRRSQKYCGIYKFEKNRKLLLIPIMECIWDIHKELEASIPSSSKDSVDFRKHGFDGSMIFFRRTFGPGNMNRN